VFSNVYEYGHEREIETRTSETVDLYVFRYSVVFVFRLARSIVRTSDSKIREMADIHDPEYGSQILSHEY
jgi:hypothetical protein